MICKFFQNKKGARGGLPSIDYLLNPQRVKNGTAKILKGDESLTRAILKSLSYKYKACVGCLSFAEANIDKEQKELIMQEFERTLLTPQMQGRYNILWVEHTDKGRLELNFVIPRVDLESKKTFTPYYHKADLARVDLFVDYINAKFDYINPKDPTREQNIKNINHHAKTFKDHKALEQHLQEQILKGIFKNRDELIDYLENDLKDICELTRKGKDYLGIKLQGDKKAVRYKGDFYAEQADYKGAIREILKRTERRNDELNRQKDEQELCKLRTRLDELIDYKAREYRTKHEREARNHSRTNTQGNAYASLESNLISSDNLYPHSSDTLLSLSANTPAKHLADDKEHNHHSPKRDKHTRKPSNTELFDYNQQGLDNVTDYINNLAKRERRARERKQRFNATINDTKQRVQHLSTRKQEFARREFELKEAQAHLARTNSSLKQRNNELTALIQSKARQRTANTRELEKRASKLPFKRLQRSFNLYEQRVKIFNARLAKARAINGGLRGVIERLRNIKSLAFERAGIIQRLKGHIRYTDTGIFADFRAKLHTEGGKIIERCGAFLKEELERQRVRERVRQRQRYLHR